ncbi:MULTISPECIES: IS66 family insertion sequence element accessory protein TnpB [unclassified Undibacterium]|uniref:IS66 family insertion sequence element accessory protein TnpB n=1 Tax=unclassified Undibacterium TaxID=2630295 RepID=UPI002AC92D1A|nr:MULTISPECIES: IS66 family insertion sequence element accessory protein TnpB [unclassified Undibacterium]MEB0141087.1 IS66 family insertion sequence element accessory protein TnpB [Undibacterium sp. CCC2.1]MEB0174108.1 IS66 family insertion sequence element accessory protein TnpB [Undibacterium sp. CCC1.1]MEB0178067.1 IS66 family insertion sequence element accessory protein TnpB [Undibacterium sp. CCC3.4]MEB0217268.1 IS66 family insertion sequence element accessory protein TnpB [Undibacterium
MRADTAIGHSSRDRCTAIARMVGEFVARHAGSPLMHAGCRIDQVYLCRTPVDFRKSIDGLSVLVEQELELSPFASALYVFINRHRNKIKVLYWHRNGFCLWLKRLEKDKFTWPKAGDSMTQTLSTQEFEWLLEGFDLWRNQPHQTLNFTSVS